MPLLPWKKKSKINQLVNEIRASSRGDSLVVQTGFPTSLIDLIVNNQDRLNRSKFNKSQIISCDSPKNRVSCNSFAPFILNSIDSINTPDGDYGKERSLEVKEVDSGKDICVLNDSNRIKLEEEDEEVEQELKTSVAKNGVFIIVIKIFLILILALGTKKFAIAITLSAFLLLFIEFVLNLCTSEDKRVKILTNLGEGEGNGLIKVEEKTLVTNFVDLREVFEALVKERRVQEIDFDDRVEDDREGKVVEYAKLDNSRRTTSAKIRAMQFKKFVAKTFGGDVKNRRKKHQNNGQSDCSTENEGEISGDRGGVHDKDEEDNEHDDEEPERKVLDIEIDFDDLVKNDVLEDGEETIVGAKHAKIDRSKRTASAKLRAKQFKKFVAKKFGGESKTRSNKGQSNVQTDCSAHIARVTRRATEEEQVKHENDNDHDDEADDENIVDRYDSGSGSGSIAVSEVSSDIVYQENLRRETSWSSSTFIPVVVVLAGLVGGRIMALVLSIVCLVLHKLLRATQR